MSLIAPHPLQSLKEKRGATLACMCVSNVCVRLCICVFVLCLNCLLVGGKKVTAHTHTPLVLESKEITGGRLAGLGRRRKRSGISAQ